MNPRSKQEIAEELAQARWEASVAARDAWSFLSGRTSWRPLLEEGKCQVSHLGARLLKRVSAADRLVRSRPYTIIGCAAGLGALIGYLRTRRRSS